MSISITTPSEFLSASCVRVNLVEGTVLTFLKMTEDILLEFCTKKIKLLVSR